MWALKLMPFTLIYQIMFINNFTFWYQAHQSSITNGLLFDYFFFCKFYISIKVCKSNS